MRNWQIAALCWAVIGAAAAQTQPAPFPPTISVVEGESFANVARLGQPLPPEAPEPAPDPKNFEGTWYHDQVLESRIERDMYGNPLPFNSKGRNIRDRRLKATYVDKTPYSNASAECVPPGQPWQIDLNFPFQIYQSNHVMTFVFQEYHGIWNIRLGQAHRTNAAAEYSGDSVGHWDGATLVVDTVGFKRSLWLDLDGTPASTSARLTSRVRKIHYGGSWRLEIVTTVDDPQMYTAPWSMVRTYGWRPNMADFVEYNCEFQLGAPGGAARYGLTPEPEE